MSDNKLDYLEQLSYGELALLKIEEIFNKVENSIEEIKPLACAAHKIGAEFPRFEDDICSILSACDLFIELLIQERDKLADKIIAHEITEEHLKEARHDLRAKVGAILGYSDLIQEELLDEFPNAGAEYINILNTIASHAKNLIPVIDELRLNDVVLSENPINEAMQASSVFPESNMSYGDQFAHCTVIIIDDSAYNRDILNRRLSRYGVNVISAENGAIGLDMVSRHSVDLILLDIMMPVMNGYEALIHLKRDSKTKGIPVLMISALSEVDSIVRCIEVGAEDYLPTPFNPIILHARIKSCLEKKILRDREQEYAEKLELVRQKLEAAIESIDDGFAVFDKEQRLSLCNKPFQRLYPGVEKLGFIGFSYEDLLRKNLQLGVYLEERRILNQQLLPEENKENWIKQHDAQQKSAETYMICLRDKRWIEVVNSLTPDGGQVSVHKDVTGRKEDEDRLTHQALHDALTGLANRSAFAINLANSFSRSVRTDEMFAIMFLDLDGFKNINDTLGHDVGDHVLTYVSQVLKKCVRAQDFVARLGGDEFAIILNAPGGKKDMSKVANRILDNIGNHYLHHEQRVPFGVSIGISCYPGDGITSEILIANSDAAMYAAKKSGKGHCRFFSDIES